ncbi:MAG: hypothetical protein OEM91_06205 [Hyphomicrobiales bacterium]|nr:hypothetical protein [Hyphomicrobiales bacterium]
MVRFLALAAFVTLLGAVGGTLAAGGQPIPAISLAAPESNDIHSGGEKRAPMHHNVERLTR